MNIDEKTASEAIKHAFDRFEKFISLGFHN
jgi:hypothetical protein